MKIRYDQSVDALTIVLQQNVEVEESDEAKPGVVLDYDRDGNLVAIEVLDASRHIPDVTTMEFQLSPGNSERSA